jgi:chromatin assembly factor 1 subunit A
LCRNNKAYAELGVVEVDTESASADWQREIDALYRYYKEVSDHQHFPTEMENDYRNRIVHPE